MERILNRSTNVFDQRLARSIENYTSKLGAAGKALSLGLSYAADGWPGVVGGVSGVIAGGLVSGAIAIGVGLAGGFLSAPVLAVGIVSIVAAGVFGSLAGSFVSGAVKDALKGLIPQEPPPNLPNPVPKGAEHPTTGPGSVDHKPGAPKSDPDPSHADDPPNVAPGGSVTAGDPTAGYDGSGWGGDPYAGAVRDQNAGYNSDGWGGDPYTSSPTNPVGGGSTGPSRSETTGPGRSDTTPPSPAGVPVVIDLDGDGIEIIPLDKSHAFFDYNGDGAVGRTAWVGGGDGILVLDLSRDGKFVPDGRIDQASEFIFTQWAPGAKTDMEALRKIFDTNRDGKLSKLDASFHVFRIWIDLNEDGTADPGELKTLAELGITYIPLTHDGKSHRLSDGSRINGTNVTVTSNGKSLTVADVALRLGTRNAALTVSPNGVNIRPGDGTVQNFYSGNGNLRSHTQVGSQGIRGSVSSAK